MCALRRGDGQVVHIWLDRGADSRTGDDHGVNASKAAWKLEKRVIVPRNDFAHLHQQTMHSLSASSITIVLL